MQHFRNHSNTEHVIDSPCTVISGLNGSGKTTILEAIHILGVGRSFRTHADKKLIQFGKPFWAVSGEVLKHEKKEVIRVAYAEDSGKKLWQQQKSLERLSQFIGNNLVIALLPNKTELITGPASERRTFLDTFLCQESPRYLECLARYQVALKQRNSLLNSQKSTNEHLAAWEAQMAANAEFIINKRKLFVQAIAPYFQQYFSRFEHHLSIEVSYFQQQPAESQDDLKKIWIKSRQRDFQLGYSSVGLHRDDIEIRAGSQLLKDVGSQGQIHSAMIALHFGIIDYQSSIQNTPLWLLLDDLFDKIDPLREQAICQMLLQFKHIQVFITDSQPERCQRIADQLHAALWGVEAGKIATHTDSSKDNIPSKAQNSHFSGH